MPFGTVNRHREKNWPIAERLVPSNDSRNNIVGRISGPVPFLFLKWRGEWYLNHSHSGNALHDTCYYTSLFTVSIQCVTPSK